MEKQVLSIEQMQELIKLGIDISKASMLWYPKMAIDASTDKCYAESHYLTINRINSEHFWNTREGKETYPTFTLQDILFMFKPLNGQWKLMDYENGFEFSYFGKNICFSNSNILEAAFNMLKWCKQNNYI